MCPADAHRKLSLRMVKSIPDMEKRAKGASEYAAVKWADAGLKMNSSVAVADALQARR